MAGDWIKMSVALRTHPKVVRISSALHADKLRVMGALFVVWSVFDAHSTDGVLDGYTDEAMDAEVGFPGFSRAMQSVGWLEIRGGDEGGESALYAPRFDDHNGVTAKRRATDAKRKRDDREVEDDPPERPKPVRKTSATNADKKRTREEKRREEQIPPNPPAGGNLVGLASWIDNVRAAGEKAVPADDPVFDYADKVGLGRDFVVLAWSAFKRRYLVQHPAKRYRDWRRVFRNAVESNWLRLWYVEPAGTYALTTVGIQAQRSLQEAA